MVRAAASSNPEVIRVEGRHAISVTDGTAVITATYKGVSASQQVATRRCEPWQLEPRAIMWLGQIDTWHINGYNVCIAHWSSVLLKWRAADPSIAKVEYPQPWGSFEVTITALAPGVTSLIATTDDPGATPTEQTVELTVLPYRRPRPEVLWMSIQPGDWLATGQQVQLEASADWFSPIRWHEDVTKTASWKSSNQKVASVTTTGLVTAHSAGDVIISVEFDGVRTDGTLRVLRSF